MGNAEVVQRFGNVSLAQYGDVWSGVGQNGIRIEVPHDENEPYAFYPGVTLAQLVLLSKFPVLVSVFDVPTATDPKPLLFIDHLPPVVTA